jgi:hypothetical protein
MYFKPLNRAEDTLEIDVTHKALLLITTIITLALGLMCLMTIITTLLVFEILSQIIDGILDFIKKWKK